MVVTCFRVSNYYVPACLRALIFHVPMCLRAYMSIYIFVSTWLRALNYVVPTRAHFLRAYVPTTTRDLETDIYQANVKSDEN